MKKGIMFVLMIFITAGIFVLPGLFYRYADRRLDENTEEYTYVVELNRNLTFTEKAGIVADKECMVEKRIADINFEGWNNAKEVIIRSLNIMAQQQDERLYDLIKNYDGYTGIFDTQYFKIVYMDDNNSISSFYVGACQFDAGGSVGFIIYDIVSKEAYLTYVNMDYYYNSVSLGIYSSVFEPGRIIGSPVISVVLEEMEWISPEICDWFYSCVKNDENNAEGEGIVNDVENYDME